ncbi:uncharacterized protein LOC117102526 [Anneissia japonica]|uniref:uncharacterized protein LOC117102526 n=1 Tax=Anneissia japonica TaxID=1529436 RepID=UPI0014255052|nr:uncharacterized protein LOC117102526 [Anneissia japonica]
MPGFILGIFFLTVTSVNAIAYIDQPSNKSVTIGNDVVLRCTVSNKGGSKLYWQKLDVTGYKFISMDGNIDPYGIYSRDIKSRYSVVGDHNLGEYNLKIERVKIDDSGKYVCVYFESGYGRYSRIAKLSVMWPAPEPPHCQVTYSSSSRRVSLICLSRGGQPLASLAWKNGNMNLKGTARKTDDVSLNIYQPGSRTFTGSTFTCVAITPALNIPRTCTVLPVYINWQRNQLHTGDDVTLTCKVFSNENDLAISWQINYEQVANSGKLTEFKDGKRKLVIFDLDISDTQMKVTCIVRIRNGLTGNATETLIINNKESAVYMTTYPTTIRTTLNDFHEITKTAHTSTRVKLPNSSNIITVSTKSITTLQRHLTDGSNFSAIEGTVIYGGPFPGPPFEVGGGGKSPLFYKIFLSAVSIVTFLLFILVIAYAMRYHRARALSQLANRRQLEDKCKDSVPMTGVLSDMASESKRSDNDDSGISYGTEIESNIDCSTLEYKENKRIIGTYPDLIISQDTNIIDEKKVEPIYMSLNNCSDEESGDEIKDQKVTNLHPVYMMLDREAEKRDEVYSCVDIRPRNYINQTQNSNDTEYTDINTQKHLYAVLEDDSEKSLVVSTRSDLRECEFSSSGYFSGESPCEYEELPESLPDLKTHHPDPSCAYAVTDLRQVRRPLRPSLKQTLWLKLTRNNSRSNTLKDGEHISRRSLPKPSRNKDINCDNTHGILTKTSSCPLVVPMGTENPRATPMDSPSQFRNAHFMANRPLISRPIFGRTVSTERGIVVTDDYAELEINPSFSESQTDDTTYESLEEYAVVQKSPTKQKLQRANENIPGLKLSPSFQGRKLPKIKKSASCHGCGSPNADRGFFSSSSEEEVGNIGPQTPPRILKNYKRIDQIRKDEARLKRASWPNRMSPKTEKRSGNSNIYSVLDVD